LKNSDTPAAAHPRRLAPPAMLTWQSHASLSPAARGIRGCTTSAASTILDEPLRRVFQVMACDDVVRLQRWVAAWEDVTEFEIVPVAAGGSAVADAVQGR